jgi:hypothetical protein
MILYVYEANWRFEWLVSHQASSKKEASVYFVTHYFSAEFPEERRDFDGYGYNVIS